MGQFIEVPLNDDVLEVLAISYSEFLNELTKSIPTFNAIGFLTRSGIFPEALRKFELKVYKSAAMKSLIPTMEGKRKAASETKVGPKEYDLYLPKRLFGTLATSRNDKDQETLELLGVQQLDPADALKTLAGASLSIEERAALVVGFAKWLPTDYHDRSLLLDSSERALTQQNSCFPPPSAGRPPVLPRWARAKFLHPELWSKIVIGLGGQPRERFRLLQGFGIHEFNSEGVITSLRKQAVATIKRGADPERVRRELLLSLFQLRETVAKDAAFPIGLTEVLCQDGFWRDAQSVHLSAEYGQIGTISGALYFSQPQLLLADLSANGISIDGVGVADFFKWIGVHEWPSEILMPIPYSVQKQVMAALPDQFEISDETHRAEVRTSELRWGSSLKSDFVSIVGLDGILASAPSEAILAWLALDRRFDPISGSGFETRVMARSGRGAFRPYHGVLPDLVREAIQTKNWLEAADGTRAAPVEAMVTPGSLTKLFKTPKRPSETGEAQFGLSRVLWARGLLHAGVPGQLSDLSEVEIYRLLGSLKLRDPGPDLVRRLYVQVLDLAGFDASRSQEPARNFREFGEVQVRKGGEVKWVRTGEALYLDRDNFPAAIREYLALLDIPPRLSAVEVQARFGVAPLSKQDFSLTVTRLVEEEGIVAAKLRSLFLDSLPFIRAFRLSQSVETARLRRLDQLVLRIVVEADVEFSLGKNIFPGKLDAGKYILDGDVLIIAVDLSHRADELMLRAVTAISDGLAELFELKSGDDFEKLLAAEGSHLRTLQLRRLLSNLTKEEFDALLSGAEDTISGADDVGALDAETFAKGSGAGEPAGTMPKTDPSELKATTKPAPAPAPSSLLGSDLVSGVTSTKLDVPSGNERVGRKIGVRISKPGRGTSQNSDVEAPTDAEQWAVLFEEESGRFPIQVSRLQGKDAFGCDCISFATAEDREAFRSDPKRIKLIDRFVEVKSGAVRLTENEVAAAEKYRKRYFIYRIQFDAASRVAAHLTVVSDPLSHKSALARECEILIDDIPKRERFRLSPTVQN
ncbi:DUF3883 domain-containing protein [Paracoccaceae bacterium Fryx2]|nr:DUF3883 domain-containing protein [Paracoccaceae bacterium Fryx2]